MSGSRELDAEDWARLAQLAELGVLSASLLHELRQPLMAIKAVAQLSVRRGRPLEGEQIGQLIDHVVQIEELLDHYAGFGRITDTPLVFDLNHSVQRAVDMLAHRQRQAAAKLELSLSPDPLPVHGRPEAMRQVAVNLLHNAYDAVETGRERVVTVSTGCADHQATVAVGDSGPGIPAALRDRLFQPFVTTKPPGRGTGLGLYIARRLVHEAGGQLTLDHPAERGTTVRVVLPLDPLT